MKTNNSNSPTTISLSITKKVKISLVIAFAIFLIRLAVWIAHSFGDISFDQVLFHIGPHASTGVPKILIHHGILELVYKPIAGFILTFALLSIPAAARFYLHKIFFWSGWVAVAFGLCLVFDVLKIGEYLDRSQFSGDWYATYGQPPTPLTPIQSPRNLIFIYVESLEKYRVTEKTTLGKFSAVAGKPKQWYMMPGTQWTLAAMISSQCGIPQMLHGFSGKNNLNEIPHPLSKAICMGDILSKADYQTLAIDSGNIKFAGNGNFLSSHGFAQVKGAEQIEQEFPGSQVPNWWGVTDSALFAFAKKQITELAANNKPFYLSMNTMNTHGPEGLLAPSCKQKGFSARLDSIFDCGVDEAGEFISWIKQQEFAKNTVIVVMGDHQIMAGRLFKNWFVTQPEPEIFFMIDRPDKVALPNKIMTHFDIFPSTLSALGFEIKNDHLGLGYNIYNKPSLAEQMDHNEWRKILRKSSAAYDALW